jgi:hypothetical protein
MELDLGGYGKKIKGTFNDVGSTATAGTEKDPPRPLKPELEEVSKLQHTVI